MNKTTAASRRASCTTQLGLRRENAGVLPERPGGQAQGDATRSSEAGRAAAVARGAVSGIVHGLALASLAAVACNDSQGASKEPAGSAAPGASANGSTKACCVGKNDCKAKGGCKTEAHACAGKNDCKGQGGCSMRDCK